jgi:hypothetical protein
MAAVLKFSPAFGLRGINGESLKLCEILEGDRSLTLQIFPIDTIIISKSTIKNMKLKRKFEIVFHEVSRGSVHT